MFIDIRDNNDFSVAGVKKLLASKDDSSHRQMRVSHDGRVGLYNYEGRPDSGEFKFWFEVWCGGNDYSGSKASNNSDYVNRVHFDLKNAWQNDSIGLVDY
jgi:hypothetical protein